MKRPNALATNPMRSPRYWRAIAMVISAATLWGLSGTASQILFQYDHFAVAWLVTIRMLVSGIVLLTWGMIRRQKAVLRVIQNPRLWASLILFSVVGLFGVQYTYMKAIATGNAASGTLLQYLGPSLIVIYLALLGRQKVTKKAWGLVMATLLGTALLVTGGHLDNLALSEPAILWGVMSALCLAFYTLFPVKLIQRYDSSALVGWAMFFGGLASLANGPVWTHPLGPWSFSTLLLIAFVVIGGTLIAFTLYLSSLSTLSPKETGLLATAEPLAAVAASLLIFHIRFDRASLFGALLVLISIMILSVTEQTTVIAQDASCEPDQALH